MKCGLKCALRALPNTPAWLTGWVQYLFSCHEFPIIERLCKMESPKWIGKSRQSPWVTSSLGHRPRCSTHLRRDFLTSGQAGGLPAISRWLRELAQHRVTRERDSGAGERASPPDLKKMNAPSRRDGSDSFAGNCASMLASLRDAGCDLGCNRWCRYAQPPANG